MLKTNVFIHIPKCGGSTVRDAMLSRYKGKQIIKVYGGTGENGLISIEKFTTKYSGGLPDKISAITGHLPYENLLKVISHNEMGNINVFSIVRNPIERAISNINYMKLKSYHSGHKWAMGVNNENLYATLLRFADKSNGGRVQANYLGYSLYFKTIKELIDTVSVYKIESLKAALINNGIINEFQQLEVKNVSKEIAKKDGNEICLLSINSLSHKQINSLNISYEIDLQLYKEAM